MARRSDRSRLGPMRDSPGSGFGCSLRNSARSLDCVPYFLGTYCFKKECRVRTEMEALVYMHG